MLDPSPLSGGEEETVAPDGSLDFPLETSPERLQDTFEIMRARNVENHVTYSSKKGRAGTYDRKERRDFRFPAEKDPCPPKIQSVILPIRSVLFGCENVSLSIIC